MDPKHYAGMAAMGVACIALAFFQNDPVNPGDRDGLTPPSLEVAAGTVPVTGEIPEGLPPAKITVDPAEDAPSVPSTKPATKPIPVKKPVKKKPIKKKTPAAAKKPAPKDEEPAETTPAPSTSVARTGDGPSVKGVITWDGKYKNSIIRPTSDPVCAEQWKDKEMRKETTVESDGKLHNVIVYVSKGLGKWTGRTRDDQVLLDQKDCRYIPHVIALQLGQPLKIKNSDPTSHNVHFKSKYNGDWNMSQNEPGIADPKEAFRRPEVGTAAFKCDQHTWMEAKVGIFDHPFFDVTGKDGTFELPGDLPPGKYTITAWHEKHKTLTKEVEVKAGETAEIQLDFKPKKGGRRRR